MEAAREGRRVAALQTMGMARSLGLDAVPASRTPAADFAHLVEMETRMTTDPDMTAGQLDRWLGWMQCAVYVLAGGSRDLDFFRDLNRRQRLDDGERVALRLLAEAHSALNHVGHYFESPQSYSDDEKRFVIETVFAMGANLPKNPHRGDARTDADVIVRRIDELLETTNRYLADARNAKAALRIAEARLAAVSSPTVSLEAAVEAVKGKLSSLLDDEHLEAFAREVAVATIEAALPGETETGAGFDHA